VFSLLGLHRNLRPEFALLYTNILLACVKRNVRDLNISPHDRNDTNERIGTYSSLTAYSLISLNSYE